MAKETHKLQWNDFLFQQQQKNETNNSALQKLHRQLGSFKKTIEDHCRQVNLRHKCTTETILPNIQNEISLLQAKCANQQKDFQELYTNISTRLEDVNENNKQFVPQATSAAVSAVINKFTPMIEKLQNEIQSIKECIIQAISNKQTVITTAVVEPTIASDEEILEKLRDNFLPDLRQHVLVLMQDENRKFRMQIEKLKHDVKESIGNVFFSLSEKIASIQEDKYAKLYQDFWLHIDSRCIFTLEERIFSIVKKRKNEKANKKTTDTLELLPPDKKKCTLR